MLTVPTAATDRIEAVPYALAHNISRPLACMRLWDEKATGAGPNALNACIVPFVRPRRPPVRYARSLCCDVYVYDVCVHDSAQGARRGMLDATEP